MKIAVLCVAHVIIWSTPFLSTDCFGQENNEPSKETASQTDWKQVADIDGVPTRICFGSCSKQTKPQPVLKKIVGREPGLFVYLGDNIYGDTLDMNVLKGKYQLLADKPEFQLLRANVPLLSVWDDHDYGANDSGKEYPKKSESEQIFLDAWHVPDDSHRRKRDGIYGVHEFADEAGHQLQIILLDTRFFRDKLKRNGKLAADSKFKNDYQPSNDPNKTLLGGAQWNWLEEQFRKPADLRIICSSIQFGHQYNGWESWTNLPLQQKKMVDLIRETKANGVIFVSGDVHWGEISRRDFDDLYPVYDVTASGLTEKWYNVEPNKYRVGEAVRENHFGMIDIDWQQDDPVVKLQIVDAEDTVRITRTTKLSELVAE